MSTTLLRSTRLLPLSRPPAFSSPAHLHAAQQIDSVPAVRAPRPLAWPPSAAPWEVGGARGRRPWSATRWRPAGSSRSGSAAWARRPWAPCWGAQWARALGATSGPQGSRSPTFGKTFLASLGGVLVGTGVGALAAQVDDSGSLP